MEDCLHQLDLENSVFAIIKEFHYSQLHNWVRIAAHDVITLVYSELAKCNVSNPLYP